jgi:hypothetical protein
MRYFETVLKPRGGPDKLKRDLGYINRIVTAFGADTLLAKHPSARYCAMARRTRDSTTRAAGPERAADPQARQRQQPPTDEIADLKEWIAGLLGEVADGESSLGLDKGGGDRVLSEARYDFGMGVGGNGRGGPGLSRQRDNLGMDRL